MKRLLCIILIIPIILISTGCNAITEAVINVLDTYKYSFIDEMLDKQISIEQPKTAISSHKAVSAKTYYGYTKLNENEKEIYDKILNSVKNYWSLIDFRENPITIDLFSKIFYHFIDDNPDIFWLYDNYEYFYNDDGELIAGLLKYQDKNKVDKYQQDSHLLETVADRDEINSMRISFANQAVKILNNINIKSHIISKEFEVYKYLGKNVKYNDELSKQIEKSNKEITNSETADDNSIKRPILQTAYGALVEKTTVCSGYAKAFQYLTNQLGIECLSARGIFDGIDHQWNIINLSGNYYHVDPTGGIIKFKDKSFIYYKYFNLTDSQIKKTHSVEPFSYKVPECKTDTFSFSKLLIPTVNSQKPNSTEHFKVYFNNYKKYNMSSIQIQFPKGYSDKKVRNWMYANYNKIKSYSAKFYKVSNYYYYDDDSFMAYLEIK